MSHSSNPFDFISGESASSETSPFPNTLHHDSIRPPPPPDPRSTLEDQQSIQKDFNEYAVDETANSWVFLVDEESGHPYEYNRVTSKSRWVDSGMLSTDTASRESFDFQSKQWIAYTAEQGEPLGFGVKTTSGGLSAIHVCDVASQHGLQDGDVMEATNLGRSVGRSSKESDFLLALHRATGPVSMLFSRENQDQDANSACLGLCLWPQSTPIPLITCVVRCCLGEIFNQAPETPKSDGDADLGMSFLSTYTTNSLEDGSLALPSVTNHLKHVSSSIQSVPTQELDEFVDILVETLAVAQNEQRRRVPSDFLCPITLEIMIDPHLCGDGFSYEKDAIIEWLETNDVSPQTNELLASKSTIPNRSLQRRIAQWLDSRSKIGVTPDSWRDS